MGGSWEGNACGILEAMYIVSDLHWAQVDFKKVRWPRHSSVLSVGSGGGEEVCMPFLCTQVSHQTWGLGLKEQGMITKNLVCESQQRLWLWKFTQSQWVTLNTVTEE